MTTASESINPIARLAMDVVALERFEKLVLLTQRTELIKQLLLVPDSQEYLLKSHIKAILEKHGLPYSPPRGRFGDSKNPKRYGGRVRFALAILLGMQMNTDDGGVVVDQEGRILSTEVLDRLIHAYHRYLQLHEISARDAEVSFEFFVQCWQSVQTGDAVLEVCGNCGSSHGNFRVAMTHQCPICVSLNLSDATATRSSSTGATYLGASLARKSQRTA